MGGATFVAQTKVTADSNLERFAAEIQVCCCCLNAQMSGFMLSRCLHSMSRLHKSLLCLIYKSNARTFRSHISNSFLVHELHSETNLSLPFNFKVQPKHHISWRSAAF